MLAHHPAFTSGLLLAGLVPFILNFPAILSSIYYLFLLPGAIFQCYTLMKGIFFKKKCDKTPLDNLDNL